MKIGILTFHNADNYGAVLQNFALQSFLSGQKFNVETIDYHSKRIEDSYKILHKFFKSKNPIKMFKFIVRFLFNYKNIRIRKNSFNRFRNEFLSISEKDYNILNIYDDNYDLYIVGSDQVWNKELIDDDDKKVYSLAFTLKKKISYAASAGNSNLMIDNVDDIKKMNYVTVREEELKDYLDRNGIDSQVVCDPVLLLNREEWEKVMEHNKCINCENNYIYHYDVSGNRDSTVKIALNLIEKDEKIFTQNEFNKSNLKYRNLVSVYGDGPIEFLQRIYNAKIVIVASFHATVFSIIFHKDFIVVPHRIRGTREKGFLKYLGLEDRIFESLEDFLSNKKNVKQIDWEVIDKKLDLYRNESRKILLEMIKNG